LGAGGLDVMYPKVIFIKLIGSVLSKGDIETNILEKKNIPIWVIFQQLYNIKESSNKLSIKLILSLQVQVYIKI